MSHIIKSNQRNGEPVVIWPKPTGATRCTVDELKAKSTLSGYVQVQPISTARAAWYGSGLVFGSVCIAMAVFGMGQ